MHVTDREGGRWRAVQLAAYLVASVVAAALGISGLWSFLSLLDVAVSPWWTLLTALPASALVLIRDRFPVAALVTSGTLCAADLLSTGGLVPIVVLLDVLYVCTRDAPSRRRRGILLALVVAVTAVGVAAFAAAGAVGATVGAAVVAALQIGALLGTDYFYAISVAQSRELLALQHQRAADAEKLAAREREAAVQNEREAMARELHDLVAGHVSAMAIRAEASLAVPPATERDRAALQAVRDSGLEAHEALRSMIALLRAPGASAAAHTAAGPARDQLAALAAAAQRGGLRVTLHDAITSPLPAAVERAVVRIVQEALANCLRYAAGGLVEVLVADDDREVRVRVHSREGVRLQHPELEGSGWGLELLSEQARAVGGRLTAGQDGDVWSVQAWMPKTATA